jgi:hypothetical protein
MAFAERAKTKLLANAYDIFTWAAMNLIVVVAVIAWVTGNRPTVTPMVNPSYLA